MRLVEDFVVESEKRYFAVRGKLFAACEGEEIPDIVKECAARIHSKFFSVDAVERQDGVKQIVQIGDGQPKERGWNGYTAGISRHSRIC